MVLKESQKEREKETDSQTNSQTVRQSDSQKNRQTDRQRVMWRGKKKIREIYRWREGDDKRVGGKIKHVRKKNNNTRCERLKTWSTFLPMLDLLHLEWLGILKYFKRFFKNSTFCSASTHTRQTMASVWCASYFRWRECWATDEERDDADGWWQVTRWREEHHRHSESLFTSSATRVKNVQFCVMQLMQLDTQPSVAANGGFWKWEVA